MVDQLAHSKLGASSADRWMNCPGSVRLCEQLPEQESSIYAEEGTKAHELAELMLKSHISNTSYVSDCDDETKKAVSTYVSYIINKYEKLGFTHMGIEKKISLAFIDECMFGTADCVLYNDLTNELEVIDYKHGAGVVVNADCTQLKYYALGALRLLTTKMTSSQKLKLSIINTIIQPRVDHSDGIIRSHRYTYEEIRDFEAELKKAVDATKEAGAEDLNVGDHCRWCNAKAICPKMESEVKETAMAVFKDDKIDLPAPMHLDTNRISQVLNFASIAESWFKSVAIYAQTIADSGEKIPGYKLVAKRSNRKWINEAQAVEVLSKSGIEPYSKKIISPAQAEKICDKDTVKNLCKKLDGGITLVPEKDKRPEIVPAIEVFKN